VATEVEKVKRPSPLKLAAILMLTLAALQACSSMPWSHKEEEGTPNEDKGFFSFLSRKSDSEERFKKMLQNGGTAEESRAARLGLAEAYFRDEDYEEAANAYKQYLEMHPLSPNSDYVQFKLGMCYYKLMLPPDRDQQYTELAIQAFEKLGEVYPASPWLPRAMMLLQECRNRLAQHDIVVGRYYYKTKQYYAALNRFRLAQTIKGIKGDVMAEALYWEGKTLEKLGEKEEALKCYEEVVKNYGMWEDVDKAEEAITALKTGKKSRDWWKVWKLW
jgi:outer membrane protein assembly factor BamD